MLGRPQRRKIVTYFLCQRVVMVEQQANFYRRFDHILHFITARPEPEPDPILILDTTDPIFPTLWVCLQLFLYLFLEQEHTPCQILFCSFSLPNSRSRLSLFSTSSWAKQSGICANQLFLPLPCFTALSVVTRPNLRQSSGFSARISCWLAERARDRGRVSWWSTTAGRPSGWAAGVVVYCASIASRRIRSWTACCNQGKWRRQNYLLALNKNRQSIL